MLLSEIFDTLNFGELAQIKLGNAGEEGITEDQYPALVTHLNQGLNALHTEFLLRENSATIQMYDNINTYSLKEEFSSANGTATVKYILDSALEPFEGKVLKINRVVTNEPDIEIKLVPFSELNNLDNLQTNEKKAVITSHDTIKINSPNSLYTLTVYYREGPNKIDANNLDPSTVEIPLPETLMEPLIYFIAARAHMRTPALEGQQTLYQIYKQKYREAINILKQEGMIENQALVNNNLSRNGWV